MFRAPWEFEGKDRRAEGEMQRAERRSSKPIDVFKNWAAPLRVYKSLVVSNQKEKAYAGCRARPGDRRPRFSQPDSCSNHRLLPISATPA